jgi:DNA-binding transcriptional LysR family regulator
MTLHQLEVFITVATWLNLRRASEELRIAQPAISHQLRLLQEEFQLQLHRKVGRGIALTAAGELLLREAKAILSRVENLRATLAGACGAPLAASLNVGGSYSLCAGLLPSVLARFKEAYADIELNLRTDSRSIIERWIVNGEVDVAVLHNPPPNRFLTMEPYRDEPLVAFVASGHPLARKRRLAVEDLREVGFIIRKPVAGVRTGKQYLEVLRKHGFTTHVVMRCDSPEAVKMAARRQMGVGVLYKDVIAEETRKGEFKVLTLPADTSDCRSFIVYHKTRPLCAPDVEFLKLLRTYRDKY